MGDLSPAAVITTAQESTGLSDFGGKKWREALDALTDALAIEAGLTEFGDVVAQADLVGSLARRLQIVEHRRTHPDVGDARIERPIFIVGQVRTGPRSCSNCLPRIPTPARRSRGRSTCRVPHREQPRTTPTPASKTAVRFRR